MVLLRHIGHADWGTHSKKRQVAVAEVVSAAEYRVVSVVPAALTAVVNDALRRGLHAAAADRGQPLARSDFPIGVPRRYSERVGVTFFRLS